MLDTAVRGRERAPDVCGRSSHSARCAGDEFTTRSPERFFAIEAQKWEARVASKTYAKRRALIREVLTTELHRISTQPSDVEVLDFGCGPGILLNDVAALGMRVTGVDTSAAMIAQARQLSRHQPRVELELIQSSDLTGDYSSRRYAMVVCISVLEYVADIPQIFEHLASLVRPGGILVISVPNRNSWLRKIEGFIHRHPRLCINERLNYLRRPDSYLDYQVHQLSLPELVTAAETFGMHEERHRFCVAPDSLAFCQGLENVGMMIFAVFVNSERPTVPFFLPALWPL